MSWTVPPRAGLCGQQLSLPESPRGGGMVVGSRQPASSCKELCRAGILCRDAHGVGAPTALGGFWGYGRA